jgi:hypothetical protein
VDKLFQRYVKEFSIIGKIDILCPDTIGRENGFVYRLIVIFIIINLEINVLGAE